MKKINKSKLLTLIVLIVIFAINTYFVITGRSAGLDEKIHEVIYSFNSETFTKIMKVFTFLGSTGWIIFLTVVVFVILFVLQKFRPAISCSVMIAVSTLINNLVKIIVRRERPIYMMVEENTFCYPSGHTMAATTLYGFFIYLINNNKKIKPGTRICLTVLLSLIIIVVGISRIYLGAHFFTDVFGAMILSTILIMIFDIINDHKDFLQNK